MIALIGAEILKLRRRWATYIVPGVGIILMGLVFLLIGFAAGNGPRGGGVTSQLRFPLLYQVIDTFVFSLGSILAISYAGAVAGADWSWGIVRVVIARGEGRSRYVLAKAAGLAIVLVIGILVAYAFGILFAFLAGGLSGIDVGNPFATDSVGPLSQSLWRGSFVLLERCAIGFGMAMILRSQVAGAIVGIVLAIGEPIATTLLTVFTIFGRGIDPESGSIIGRLGNQWYQYLPFNIGNSVLPTGSGATSDPSTLVLPPVPFEQAVIVTFLYIVGALAIACLRTNRSQAAV